VPLASHQHVAQRPDVCGVSAETHARVVKSGHYLFYVLGAAVIRDDHLDVGVGLREGALKGHFKVMVSVVGRDDNTDQSRLVVRGQMDLVHTGLSPIEGRVHF
jgi:hypothetical protein